MPITIEPQWNPVSASRPIVFRAFSTAADPNTVKHAVVRLFLRGNLYATFFVKPFDTTPSATPGFTEYFFDIDVAELIRTDIGIKSILPSLVPFPGSGGNANNNDLFADFFIEVSYQTLDATTGLLGAEVFNEVSNTFTAFSTTRQNLESMDLEEFITVLPSQLGRPLTNAILQQDICPNQNASISWIDALNYLRVVPYDLNGNTFPGFEFFSAVPGATDVQSSTGVGTANIYAKTYFNGEVLPTIDQISRYEIDLGIGVVIGTAIIYTKVTDTYTYNITTCCDTRQIRLHWLNSLGGLDSYNFTGSKRLEQQSRSSKGEKALTWATGALNPHQPYDYGEFRYNVTGRERFILETIPLTDAEAAWLSEIAFSSFVIAEQDGVYYSVNIEDSRQVLGDSTTPGRLNLQINISNQKVLINV